MGKKYELVKNEKIEFNGHTLYRIKALKDINEYIRKGDFGGYIEKEENLSQEDECFVCENAKVYGDSELSGCATAMENAVVRDIKSNCATFEGNSFVIADGQFTINGEVEFSGNVKVLARFGSEYIFGDGSCFTGDYVVQLEEGNVIDVSDSDVARDVFNFNYEE